MPGMPSRSSAAAAANPRADTPPEPRSAVPSVDTRREPSLTFAPLERPIERERSTIDVEEAPSLERASDARSRRRRPRIVVEAGRRASVASSFATTGGHLGMSEYPVQISKVQAPPLREETLARDRLLEWLAIKVHRRVILLTAEAGYGKTTLLADFSRRTRLRVLWFRLDRGDRDWVGFIAYLVAAVRIHLPDFGAASSALLRETATSAPPLDTVLDTFLRELAGLPSDPTVLVFDDFHLVDDSPDVRHILRELLARGPERMTFVFASRREPPIRLARLRALGEVAELGTNDLRFDASETERLFRDTYEMRLEPSVLAELSRRTEGWAASLQLVRSALHDRDPGQRRAFISSLSGAEGHLYEYLAEEVVGDLPEDLQQFLMRTSVLETVDLVLGPVAAEVTAAEARAYIEAGERHGLFGRRGPEGRRAVRAHPLVRDFLADRLARSVGEAAIRAIRLRVARVAESHDWRIASRHYIAAHEEDEARRVLTAAVESILATGSYATAHDLADQTGWGLGDSADLVLRSRLAQQRASIKEGLELAEEAWRASPDSTAVLLNLVAARTLAGDVSGALEAGRVLGRGGDHALAQIGRVYQLMIASTTFAPLRPTITALDDLIAMLPPGDQHFRGVAWLNLSYLRLATNEPAAALEASGNAVASLSMGSGDVELNSAYLARAMVLAFVDSIEAARTEYTRALERAAPGQMLEVANEIAHIEGLLGETAAAWPLLERVAPDINSRADGAEQAILSRVVIKARDGDIDGAIADAEDFEFGEPQTAIAFEARRHLSLGFVLTLAGDERAKAAIDSGTQIATSQGAALWATYGRCLSGLADRRSDPSLVVRQTAMESQAVLSMVAEAIAARATELDPDALETVRAEARRRPSRWWGPMRQLLRSQSPSARLVAAATLELIGQRSDIKRLREAAKTLRARGGSEIGLSLARRLADRVTVEDLGRISLVIGERVVEGAGVRRKVMALLAFLLTRTRFSSTREEVTDALWPDLDPASALNSLNQTVYFLRRVFEPHYREELSPGYVGQDGETIWLDPELVEARSRRCQDLIRSMLGNPDPEACVSLAREYRGRFALDFAYEDWSTDFRDSLHAAYLRVSEHAIRSDLATGHFERGIFLAERAAEVDPDADEIQTALVRLYRLSGAHAAAGEQYGHYMRAMRDLGEDPAPLEEL